MASGSPDISSLPINPVRMELQHEKNPVRFASPWSGRGQVLRRFGRWRMVLEWERLTRTQFDGLMPLFERYGSERSFTIFNPKRPLPTGNATVASMAALKVAGASQTGQALNVDGAPNSTLLFRAGDFIGLANTGQVFKVYANCTSNGSGAATIQLCQYIDASPADNEDVIVSYVPFTMLLDEDPREQSTGPGEQSSFSVAMSEWF